MEEQYFIDKVRKRRDEACAEVNRFKRESQIDFLCELHTIPFSLSSVNPSSGDVVLICDWVPRTSGAP
ncbi:unnamed protein product [Allacma fusca]|uniref:Uncharacterized protein n=1 Tax=Allacma fusca TaxID=39272 RepID=A0A8J2PB10_9HEXA|nr:unnamed protein product [Allacma fusca]